MKKLFLLGTTVFSLVAGTAGISQATGLRAADSTTDINADLVCSNIPSSASSGYVTNLQGMMGGISTPNTVVAMLNALSTLTSVQSPSSAIPSLAKTWYNMTAPAAGTGFRVSSNTATTGSSYTYSASDWTPYTVSAFAFDPVYNNGTVDYPLPSTISSIPALDNVLTSIIPWSNTATTTSVVPGAWIDLAQAGKICTFTIQNPLATNPAKASRVKVSLLFTAATSS